jgi:hypothetical protein
MVHLDIFFLLTVFQRANSIVAGLGGQAAYGFNPDDMRTNDCGSVFEFGSKRCGDADRRDQS